MPVKKGQVEKLKIRKMPNKALYKVYTPTGRALEMEPISLAKAKKQVTAVHLSELRAMGRISSPAKSTKVKKM